QPPVVPVAPNGRGDLLRARPPADRRAGRAPDAWPGRDTLARRRAAPLARPGRRGGRRRPGRARRAPGGSPGGHARDRPREPGPGVLRVAFSDRVPHLPRSGAPAVRRGSVAPPTDAYRRRRGVLPDRPRRPPDPRGLARAPPRGRRRGRVSLTRGTVVVPAVQVATRVPAAMAGDERSRVAPGAGQPRSGAASRPLDAMAGDERNRVAPGAGHPRSVAPSRPLDAMA